MGGKKQRDKTRKTRGKQVHGSHDSRVARRKGRVKSVQISSLLKLIFL